MCENNLLSDKLKELRKAHNINQDVIADYLGITRQSYSHYEVGKRTPSLGTLFKISKFYNISVEDLLSLAYMPLTDEPGEYIVDSSYQNDWNDYISFMNNPKNFKKLNLLSQPEKDMIYYLEKLSDDDKAEIVEIAKMKYKKSKRKK